MTRSSTLRLCASAAGGLLVASPLAVVAASPAQAAPCADYAPRAVTNTSLSVQKTVVRRGASNRATVRVSSAAGTPNGRVTLRVVGVNSWTLRLQDGRASRSLPTNLRPDTYRVVARYAGTSCYRPSADEAFYTVKRRRGAVLGEEGRSGGNQGNNRPGAVLGADASTGGPSAGGLGATGASESMGLLALLGGGLLAAGGLVLAGRRRAH